eukprot:TRINITY_DN189_c0_g1_i1.p1 TRINITY_DN189_c0_g1~~TRINITY_DN189_c0_g1_i1.p1  ORF type:complete len:533 (-),score=183.47 TRINITY_DN189_c0_g1_i1:66-1664(-)
MKNFGIFALFLLIAPNLLVAFDLFGSGGVNEIELDEKYEKTKQTMHSFKNPFFLVRGSISFWAQTGDTVITNDYIRLTPAEKSRSGSIWNTKAVSFKDWEVSMNFKVGSTSALGADGFAVWYTKESKRAGNVYGNQDKWKGLGIVFDTFDNDGGNDNPSISVFHNDGTVSYDSGSDGKHQALGSCRSYFRNYETKIRLIYLQGTLQVLTKLQSQADWSVCTTVAIDLPEGYFFGISAATGGLADNHDIFKFEVNKLVAKVDTNQEELDKINRQAEEVDNEQFFRNRDIPVNNEENSVEEEDKEKTDATAEKSTPPAVTFEQVQTPPLPPPPPAAPVSSGDVPQVLGNLQRDVELLSKTQSTLQHSLNEVQNALAKFTQTVEADASRLENLVNQNQKFSETFQNFVNQLPTKDDLRSVNVDSSDFSKELQFMRTQLDELKKTVEIKSRSTITAKQVESLSHNIAEIKNRVEASKQIQLDLEKSLKTNQQQLHSTIENSSSLGFWIYFVIVQVMFGSAFMWWKKFRDESSKKLL